jgi:capsular polysaccharide biosynthesis protein
VVPTPGRDRKLVSRKGGSASVPAQEPIARFLGSVSGTSTTGISPVGYPDRVKKLAYKGLWSMVPSYGDPATVHTIARRQPPKGYSGDFVVREIKGPVFIEPEYGYVITQRGRLIEDSIETNYFAQPAWRIALPSPTAIVRARRRGNVQSFERVVSLRHWWEWNYYHFYLDVLGKIAAFEEIGIAKDVPLLVGRYARQIPWVKQILETGGLQSRPWIIHDEGLIEAQSVVYCRAQLTYRVRTEAICSLLNAPHPSQRQRRIFLNRRGPVSRQIINLSEVLGCLSAYDFEDVDTLGMPLAEQMQIFADTRHLVAIHGAGLVNILYRQSFPLSVLELYGSGHNTFDFKRLCNELGYDWTGLACEFVGADPSLADIEVDIDALSHYLETLTDDSVVSV